MIRREILEPESKHAEDMISTPLSGLNDCRQASGLEHLAIESLPQFEIFSVLCKEEQKMKTRNIARRRGGKSDYWCRSRVEAVFRRIPENGRRTSKDFC